MEDAFKAREKALENHFFHAVDRALIERMRDDITTKICRKSLRESTGISDEHLLDELIAEGIEPATLVAFMLLPLACVAWADGQVAQDERDAVMNSAIALGLTMESAGAQLLSRWLDEPPHDELFEIWRGFAAEIAAGLSHVSRQTLIDTILHRSKTVAQATGGFLGVGRISPAEGLVLQQIEAAFPTITREHP